MTDIPAAAPTQIVSVQPPPRTTWRDWLPVLSLLLVVGTMLLTGGRSLETLSGNTRRIEVLEQRADRRDDLTRDMQVRMAGMDAKLDLLLDRAKAERR
jgi:hypothetical protein